MYIVSTDDISCKSLVPIASNTFVDWRAKTPAPIIASSNFADRGEAWIAPNYSIVAALTCRYAGVLVETGQKLADLDFTHIWFSHEHPDHFSPPALKEFPEERRRRTPVLYQQTRDRKVRNFCDGLGAPVIELAPFEPHTLDRQVTVTSSVVAGYDSWLHVRCPGGSILNANDCRLIARADLERIKAITGDLDLLMTQFGYANW